MKQEITPLKEFDKNINYYQLIVGLEDFLVKIAEPENIDDLARLFNEIKAFVFSDETLKSIYMHNIETQCNNKKYPTEEENEQNTNVLIAYMEQMGYKYKITENNTIIDLTNQHFNIIEDYFFPSCYKILENKFEKDIVNIKDVLNITINPFEWFMQCIPDLIEPSLNLNHFNCLNFEKIVFKKLFEFDILYKDYDFLDDTYHCFYYRNIINRMLLILVSTLNNNYCTKYYNISLKNINKNLKQKKITKGDQIELLLTEYPNITNKEIAIKVKPKMNPNTVDTHIKRLCKKYNLNQLNKATLVAFLQETPKNMS